MNKQVLTHFLIPFVLVIGLVSCSKEKSSDQRDTFSIDPPILHAQFRESGANFKLNSQTISLDAKVTNAIYPTSVIELPSLKNQNFVVSPVTMNVTSICQSATAKTPSISFRKSISNAQSFEIINIIDPALLVALSASQGLATCSFDFVFTNSVGSTETFHYRNISLAPMIHDDLADININSRDENGREFSHTLAIVFENRDRNVKYPLISQTQLGYVAQPNDAIMLVCESYVSQIYSKNSSEITLDQFDGAPLIWNSNLNGEDPRMNKPDEECRIMTEIKTAQREMKFSREFHLVQKSADLKFNMILNPKLFSSVSKTKNIEPGVPQELFRLEISNTSDLPTSFALGSLQVQVVGQNAYTRNQYFDQNLTLTTMGGQFISNNANLGKMMSLSPHTQMVASYGVILPGSCIQMDTSPNQNSVVIFPNLFAQIISTFKIVQFTIASEDGGLNNTYYKVFDQFGVESFKTENGHDIFCQNFPPPR